MADARTRGDIRGLLDQLTEASVAKREKLWTDLNWVINNYRAAGMSEADAVREVAQYMATATEIMVWDGQHK